MNLALVYSRAGYGVEAPPVTVEVHLSAGLPGFGIVGLPEAAVKESKDRVRSALLTSHFEFPAQRITVNLAPADVPKDGSRLDLPIALGILAASGQIDSKALERREFIGELALSGELRRVPGSLPVALACQRAGRELIAPTANAEEVGLANARCFTAAHLLEVTAHLAGKTSLPLAERQPITTAFDGPDLAEVHGQHQAKRALTIAAAGGHNLLLIGPPGTGKTMLASRLPGILPPMSEAEALAAASIKSIAGQHFDPAIWGQRPFRAPHHTASAVALVGGSANPRPGEISLAHHGVLFLDELPEFDRHVLEVLREPLESGRVTISRAASQAEFPARFQLVAAMNPCPCGHFGQGSRCRCSMAEVKRYLGKLSGPFLDRIDMHIEVPPVPHAQLLQPGNGQGESSASVRASVIAVRAVQEQRGVLNADLSPRQIQQHCKLAPAERNLLHEALDKLGLSARACHRILRVARTIADLSHSDNIGRSHLLEALSYRKLERLQQVLS